MTTFYWSKAVPGVYFLWDMPKASGAGRGHLGKVWRGIDGRYHGYFDNGTVGVRIPSIKTSPDRQIENMESAIFRLLQDATFIKEF